MSVLDARKDSNAAKGGAENGPSDSGDAEILGFTKVDYPDDLEPVMSNHDVKSSGDNIAARAMGNNLGTSRDSYKFQPDNPNAEEGWGKTKESATKVFGGK